MTEDQLKAFADYINNTAVIMKCVYCGFECPSHQQETVYFCNDWKSKTREIITVCPSCRTIHSMTQNNSVK